jgi:trigger factor
MEIKRIAIDAVNEIIEMTVVQMDYKGQVAKRINEKMPLATVKGFRKGAVPKDLVAKQYGKPIKIEEVQKVVNLALERYIVSQRLNLLGTPIPVENESFSWDNDDLVFQFEIGLAPTFDLDLEPKTEIIKYNVIADEKLIDGQLNRIQKQFGKVIQQDEITENSDIKGTFSNLENNIDKETEIALDLFKDKAVAEKFIGKKPGDVVVLNTKGLFHDDHQLMDYLGINHDEVHSLDIDVEFTIESIKGTELANFDQELFDKLFGEGKIASLDELKAKIKEDAEAQFAVESQEKLYRDVQEALIENTKFDLPAEFLKKWLQNAGEKQLSEAEAEKEYNRSEKGLRFQMIEGKAMAQTDLKVSFEDLKSYTNNLIRQQMAQFGQANASDQEIEGIVAKVLSNQEEVKRLSREVVKEKMLQVFVEKANPTTKEVTYDEFVAAMYGE